MIRNRVMSITIIILILMTIDASAGESIPFADSIEITCIDEPVQLGFSGGVIFRASCPGIWAMRHQRIDENSFRRRFFSYRHFTFRGYWEVKDQGVIEALPSSTRELFMVLPGDLIEFKLLEPDCYCKIDVTNIGYIKKAGLCELQEWLAYNTYMQRMDFPETGGNGLVR
ncbi:MAG: hypothetical protein ACP5VS_04730 [Desulfomonilaceae bacterium]